MTSIAIPQTNAFGAFTRTVAFLFLLPVAFAWGDDWAFNPDPDTFDAGALFDLRYLNEDIAGDSGWISHNAAGDFVRGDGKSVRFWAVNTGVERSVPFVPRNQDGWQTEQTLQHHARWLAKRGVNLIRLHAHINPDPDTQDIDEVNQSEVDWIWRSVGAMREEGVYSVVSPYWANTMESSDTRWGTEWGGSHHGLLFFDETLQAAYKEWLRTLFTTPTEHLGGRTLAEEPALAIFQIQNEDSLLFWTVDRLPSAAKATLEGLFYDWAVAKHGSIESAFEIWGSRFSENDNLEEERLGISILWNLTGDGKAALGASKRMDDQLQFYVETMIDFNEEIRRFVREDLNCPVLVNAGNWKTADVVNLEDSERYSYAASSDVVALNRYFGGVHSGPNNGWAIIEGDHFTSPSALRENTLSLPISVKQPVGKPIMVTESTWVMPVDTAFEAPMLISAYSSLSGFDAYFWFAAGTQGFVPPRSANGFLPSQEKWLCLTPEMAGQWPAAALAFRRGYIKKGDTVLEEHRALDSMWQRRSPVIAESASFDPNRDSGDLPPDSSLEGGVDPLAFLVGTVEVHYGSEESNTKLAANLETWIEKSDTGARVTSNTGEIVMDTAEKSFVVNTPKVQSLVAYSPTEIALRTVAFDVKEGPCSVTAISLDGRDLAYSSKVLVQRASPSRPTGWVDEDAEFEVSNETVSGKRVVSYGSAPWEMRSSELTVSIANKRIVEAIALDANGMPIAELDLEVGDQSVSFEFPDGVLYVALRAEPGVAYDEWKDGIAWSGMGDAMLDDPDGDGSSNLMEFVKDGSPLLADSSGLNGFTVSSGSEEVVLSMEFRQGLRVSGVLDEIEGSVDSVNWRPIQEMRNDYEFEVADSDPDGDGSALLQRLNLRFNPSEAPFFLRRKVAVE